MSTTATNTTPNEQQPPPAQAQQQVLNGKRIIIRNLPQGTSRDELRELGDKYGRVVSVEMVPKPDRPFGFISFLSEDDALFTIYRLHGYRYKNNILEVSLSTSKPQQKPKIANRAVKPDEKPKKFKKSMCSLRTLTPLNPPTPSPQQQQPSKSNDSTFKWQDHTHLHSPVGNNGNQLDQENGYPPNSGYDQQSTSPTTNSGGKGGKQRRNNNNNNNNNNYNNNNNRRGKSNNNNNNYKKIDHHQQQYHHETTSPTDNTLPADSTYVEGGHGQHHGAHQQQVPVTEVRISVSGSQERWHFKVGPAQWQEFLKAIDPFLQDHELQ